MVVIVIVLEVAGESIVVGVYVGMLKEMRNANDRYFIFMPPILQHGTILHFLDGNVDSFYKHAIWQNLTVEIFFIVVKL